LPAKIIDIEGIDQSGKRTQTRLLAEDLKKEGAKVSTISYPIYKSPSGRQIQRFLQGKQNYPATALHMLYSLNRWENQELIVKLTETADFVIADRYYPSNFAYGVSRGLSLGWLQGLDRGLPTAEPRHCSRRARALIFRSKIDWEGCSRKRQTVAVEGQTDLWKVGKETGMENG